jgi:hypothetical protein
LALGVGALVAVLQQTRHMADPVVVVLALPFAGSSPL